MHFCPDHGKVPGIIAQARFLFIGIVMFLIHNNDADVPDRRKNCRPGTNDDINLAKTDFPPLVQALSLGKHGVNYRNFFTKPCPETPFCLGNQGNFRHQYNGPPALFHGIRHQAHVHFGLAGPGYARQQTGGEHIPPVLNFFYNCGLFFGQFRRNIRCYRFPQGIPEHPATDHVQPPGFGHGFNQIRCCGYMPFKASQRNPICLPDNGENLLTLG